MAQELHHRWEVLLKRLRAAGRVLVAFSGGCDSTLLLSAARETIGREHLLAVTAVSASLPAAERGAAERLACALDVPFLALETRELDNPAYAANPSNRCFFCKDELFARLHPLASQRSMVIADGFNASDRADYRPGREAAERWGVLHPLDDAELTKENIRVLSRWRRLDTWNKPASPCLSSRIPYGVPVTVERLRRIERAEAVLHDEGFRIVRVRDFMPEARIEVPREDIERLRDAARWARVTSALQASGFERVILDPRGFRSGRLNEAIAPPNAHAYERHA